MEKVDKRFKRLALEPYATDERSKCGLWAAIIGATDSYDGGHYANIAVESLPSPKPTWPILAT